MPAWTQGWAKAWVKACTLAWTAACTPSLAFADSPCFHVGRVLLSAPDTLPALVRDRAASALPQDPFAFAQAWLDRYRGHCLDRQAIESLVKGVSQAILEQGYVTSRVLVPEQHLGSGVLRLALIPGIIGELRFAEADTAGTWKTAFPTQGGELLRLPDLEQGLEQMKRVPSQDVRMEVVPTGTPGVSDVVIAVSRGKPWSVVASVDDAGNRPTGKRQGNLTLAFDSPLGINDAFSVGYGRDLPLTDNAGGTAGWNGSYSLPFGYWTATLSASRSGYRQQVAGVHQTFAYHGESQSLEMKLQRVIHRSQNDVLGLYWRLARRFGKRYIEDTEIAQQRRNNALTEFGITDRRRAGAVQMEASLMYRQGVGGLGAQPDILAADAGPTWRFRMALADASLSMPLPLPALPPTYATALHGQFANQRLYFVDAFTIGGRQTVRGFDGDNMLAGETGFYWRNELQWPIAAVTHVVYSGLDYGRVYGPSAAALAGTQLAGAVVGMRGAFGSRFGSRFGSASYDLFVGTPVSRPRRFHTAALTGGFLLVYQY